MAALDADADKTLWDADLSGRIALVVGNDNYRNVSPLRNARSDARAVARALEVAGFEVTLRLDLGDRGLKEALRNFKAKVEGGDDAVFYFSGHGSRMRNSLSDKLDKLDVTIVPVDSVRGAPDIRDKDFKKLMNQALDPAHGAILTAIFDSCHSGGMTRGGAQRRAKQVPDDMRDARERPDGKPTPASQGALILSAAQDFEKAWEDQDESDHLPHGAFTLALLRVLGAGSLDLSAQEVFTRVRAAIKIREIDKNLSASNTQEPVIETNEKRLRQPLLGVGIASRQRPLIVQSLEGAEVRLQGGIADGLNPGCVLRAAKPAADGSVVRLVVQEGISLSSSFAKIQGQATAQVKVNDAFLLDQYVAGEVAFKVGLLPTLEEKGIKQILAATSFLRGTPKWVEDPTGAAATTHVLAWDGKAWWLRQLDCDGKKNLGAHPSSKELQRLFKAPEVRVFLQVPLNRTQDQGIQEALGSGQKLVALEGIDSPTPTHYVLLGRAQARSGGKVAINYTWVRRGAAGGATQQSGLTLPASMPWQDLSDPRDGGVARMVNNYQALARIHGWMTLASPPKGQFGYKLTLMNKATGKVRTGEVRTVTTAKGDRENQMEAPLVVGEDYVLALQRDPTVEDVQQRYVYVFLLDQDGVSKLFYPLMDKKDRLPRVLPRLGEVETVPIPLDGPPISISEPVGTDTYCMLTSDEQIHDLSVFDWSPEADPRLKTKGTRSASGQRNPLERLIASGGTRRGDGTLPTNWTLQRVEFQSTNPTK